jgi:hypothetical protein
MEEVRFTKEKILDVNLKLKYEQDLLEKTKTNSFDPEKEALIS